MARFEVTAPDGKRYEVTVSNSMSEAEVMKYVEQQFKSQSKPQAKTAEQQMAEDRETYNPTKGMSTFDKVAAGFGKAIVDTGRGVGQMVGLVDREDVAESRARDQPLMNTGAGIAGNVLGNVAIAAPTALIPGAQTIAGAGLVGAGLGLAQPSTSTAETIKNIGIGGVGGAAVPAIVRGAQVARSFVDPLYQGGRERIIGRTLRNAAGNQADDAMRNMRAAQPLVPGSMPTAAEAAQNPGIAALQRTATATDPVAMNQLVAGQAANNEARIAALRGVSGNKAALSALQDARADAADVAYRTARNSDAMRRDLLTQEALAKQEQYAGLGSLGNVPKMTDAQAIAGAIRPSKALEDLAKRPAFQSVVNQARTLAANRGQEIGNPLTSIDGLHYIKIALDDALEFNPTNPLGRNAKSALMGIKDTLLKEMDEISPVYGAAREAYTQASRPITQMQIGQELESAINPLTGVLRPQAYASALNDSAAQRVTGMANATLESTVEPAALDSLRKIQADLLRSNFAQTAGKGAGSDTVQKMAFNNMMETSGLPSALRGFAPMGVVGNLAQRAGNVFYADANQRMSQQLANALLDPQQAAGLMEAGMVTPQMQQLVNAIRRTGAPIGGAAAGSVQALQE